MDYLLLANPEKISKILSPEELKKFEDYRKRQESETRKLETQKLTKKDLILKSITNGNKQEVLSLLSSEPSDDKLLWIIPTAELLTGIKSAVIKYGLKGVCSIGCGTGILEWLLYKGGLKVSGIESQQFTQ